MKTVFAIKFLATLDNFHFKAREQKEDSQSGFFSFLVEKESVATLCSHLANEREGERLCLGLATLRKLHFMFFNHVVF